MRRRVAGHLVYSRSRAAPQPSSGIGDEVVQRYHEATRCVKAEIAHELGISGISVNLMERSFTRLVVRMGSFLRNLGVADQNQIKSIAAMKADQAQLIAESRLSQPVDAAQLIANLAEHQETSESLKVAELRIKPSVDRIHELFIRSTDLGEDGRIDLKFTGAQAPYLEDFRVPALPEHRESLRAHEFRSFISVASALNSFHDALPDFEVFMAKFYDYVDQFNELAKKQRGGLAQFQLTAFKSLCYAIAAKNHNRPPSLLPDRVHVLSNTLASDLMRCPYGFVIEPEKLELLFSLVKSIPTEPIARMVIQNPQWAFLKNNFEQLAMLIDELKSSSQSATLAEILQARDVHHALDLVIRLKQKQELERLYQEVAAPVSSIDSVSPRAFKSFKFAYYALYIADQKIDGETTFHDLLKDVSEKMRTPRERKHALGSIIYNAENICYSLLWPDIANLLKGEEGAVAVAFEAIVKLSQEEFDAAEKIILEHIKERREHLMLEFREVVRADYPAVTEGQLDILVSFHLRMQQLGVEPRFLKPLKKRELSLAVSVAKDSVALSDRVASVIFSSAEIRNLFVTAVEEGVHDLGAALITFNEDVGDEELTSKGIVDKIQRSLGMLNDIDKRQFGRIVLISGSKPKERDNLAARLEHESGYLVKVVPDRTASLSYLKSLLTPNDLVVIDTTDQGHSVSRNASSFCKSRGITYLPSGHTNSTIILDRLRERRARSVAA